MAADSMDNTTPVCGRCQAALSSAAPEGLCPKCIFDLALNPGEPPAAHFTDSAETVSIPMTPFTGTRLRYFGVYELLEEIARGGMGVVFKARQVNLNRLVALKLISSGALATDAIIKRFKAEAEAAAVLNHLNIVPIHEIGEVQGQHYFSMGLIEGQNLREYVEQHKPSPRQAAEIIIAIARAVHHAHQHGVLHRDIKPSNILIDQSGTPHLTDFGLAKIVQHDSTLTHTNAILGTPSYMAPEQARGETKHVTTAADVYGLGAVLYECLTGQPPFAGGTSIETIRQVLDQDARPPSRWNPSVDRDLDTICLKCLEKDPARRYASAEALTRDLEHWVKEEPIMARPITNIERFGKWTRRRPAVAALLVVSSLMVLATAGILIVEQMRRGERELRRQAQSERHRAEHAQAAEVEARKQEAEQRVLSELARATAEKSQYLRDIALAEREWAANNVASARRFLDDAPVQLRHWEWHYLKKHFDGELLTLRPQSNSIRTVAISPDGKYLATGTGRGSRIGEVQLWDAATGEKLYFIGENLSAINALVFSPDGDRLAIASSSGTHIWNLKSHSLSWSLNDHKGHVTTAAFSPNGKYLVTGSADKTVSLRDADNGTVLQTMTQRESVNKVVFSPDGNYLAIASGQRSRMDTRGNVVPVQAGELVLIEISTGSAGTFPLIDLSSIMPPVVYRRTEEPLTDDVAILDVAFSPTGTSLASTHSDKTVIIWDTATARLVRVMKDFPRQINALAFSPDGQRLALGGEDKNVTIKAAATGAEEIVFRGHERDVLGVLFNSEGNLVISASSDQTVKIWNSTSEPGARSTPTQVVAASHLAVDNSGQRVAWAGPNWITIADAATLTTEFRLSHTNGGPYVKLAFSPNGKYCAASGNSARIWNLADREHSRTLTAPADVVYGIAFSPDSQRIAGAGGKHFSPSFIMMWDVLTGSEVERWDVHGESIWNIAFSPDGELLASVGGAIMPPKGNALYASAPGEVKIWELKTKNELYTLRTHNYCVWDAAFSPDNRLLATASSPYEAGVSGEVKIWDVSTGKEKFTITDHESSVFSVAFSPDGKRIVTADGFWGSKNPTTVKLWDTETGLKLLSLSGHNTAIYAVAFTRDGRRIFSAGANLIKMWDAGDAFNLHAALPTTFNSTENASSGLLPVQPSLGAIQR